MVVLKEKNETFLLSGDSENCQKIMAYFLTFFILKTFSCLYSRNDLNMRGKVEEFGKVMQI